MSVADGGPVSLPEDVTRADAILIGMPLLFVGAYGVAAAAVGGWAVPTATAALACALPMVEGIVRNPPGSR